MNEQPVLPVQEILNQHEYMRQVREMAEKASRDALPNCAVLP